MGCDDQFCGFEPWEPSPVPSALLWKTFVWLHHITKRQGLGWYTKFWLKCLYQATIVSSHIRCICVSCLNPNSLLSTIYFVFSCRMVTPTTSRYESNYIKIAMVVLQVSPRAVRVQFDREFHPDCLQRTLNRNVFLLTNLKATKHMTQPQLTLLFPRTGRLLYLFCLI